MKIENFNKYKFSGSGKDDSNYILDESSYIVAIREDSLFSHLNIIPLYYSSDDLLLGINEEEIGNKILVVRTQKDTITDDIDTRFHIDEFFKIVRGPIAHNDKHELDPNLPKRRIYKNYLQPFKENEIIEVFPADIDLTKGRIRLKDDRLRDLMISRYTQSNQVLFIKDETGKVIGPFKLTGSDDEGYFTAQKSNEYKFGIYFFTEEDLIDISPNNINRIIIFDNRAIARCFHSEYDYITDRHLIEWFFNSLINENNQTEKFETSTLINQINKAFSYIEYVDSKERYKRISSILSSAKETFVSKNELLKALPEFHMIKSEIESLEKKRLDIRNSLVEKEQEHAINLQKISEQHAELIDLEKRLQISKQRQLEEQDKIRDTIKTEIDLLEKKKADIDKEIQKEWKEKQTKILELDKDIDYKERRKTELQTGIDSLKSHFTSEQKTAHEKLSELVKQNTHFNFISGRDLSLEFEKPSTFSDYTIKDDIEYDYIRIREEINQRLKSQQRHFDTHFIDNLLICIHQNTLTLFAGLPGTGKTSLAKLLTSALTPQSRIREVPVSRGWTSQKDMIGFANPLTKKFHAAQTGIYNLLQQLDYEWKENTYMKSPLSFILLDEANLSPIEHYWSIFYSTTDSVVNSNKPISINLGQSEILNHANTIRFIGTINYDQTTETLSPRILDRTNIIRLMPKSFRIENLSINEVTALNISYERIINIFKLHDFANNARGIQMSDDLLTKYTEIKDIFRNKLNIYISPRVELGIKRYCEIASMIMTESSRPLDYCIAQRLLPLINIQGKKKNELEGLLKVISNFNLDNSVSESILESIIEIGSRNGYTQDNYNYFNTLSHV